MDGYHTISKISIVIIVTGVMKACVCTLWWIRTSSTFTYLCYFECMELQHPHTNILKSRKNNAKTLNPKMVLIKVVQKLWSLRCPPGGEWPWFFRRWDQFGGCWNQFIVSEQQHHSQHTELREDKEATQSPADQPTNSAGHHLWLLAHEPLQPLPSHSLTYTSNATGE